MVAGGVTSLTDAAATCLPALAAGLASFLLACLLVVAATSVTPCEPATPAASAGESAGAQQGPSASHAARTHQSRGDGWAACCVRRRRTWRWRQRGRLQRWSLACEWSDAPAGGARCPAGACQARLRPASRARTRAQAGVAAGRRRCASPRGERRTDATAQHRRQTMTRVREFESSSGG